MSEPYNHLLRVAEVLADCDQPTDDDTYNAWEHALTYFKQNAFSPWEFTAGHQKNGISFAAHRTNTRLTRANVQSCSGVAAKTFFCYQPPPPGAEVLERLVWPPESEPAVQPGPAIQTLTGPSTIPDDFRSLCVLVEPIAVEVPGMVGAKRRNRTLEASTFIAGEPASHNGKWMLTFNEAGLWFDAWADTEPKTELA